MGIVDKKMETTIWGLGFWGLGYACNLDFQP